MSKIIRVFACLFTLFFVGSAYAAGYTCDSLKKYTSCSAGYYMTKGGTYNGTPQVGNACTACTSGCTCAGGTKAPVCGTTCSAGKYWDGSACATCPNGYYCPGFSNVQNPATNYGRNACPTANSTTAAASSAYPDSLYPYKSTTGSVDKTTEPTRDEIVIQPWGTGWATINACMANYGFSNVGGSVRADNVKYNSSTGKYDNFSNADIYYHGASAGYYLYTKYSDIYCDTDSNRMFYRKVVACPAGSYCPGGWAPKCSTGTYNNEWGRNTCPAGKYCPAKSSAGTNCAAGTYRSATGGTAPSSCTACAIGSYSSAGATGCTACSGGKTTTATGQSSCNATCTNATGASTWTAASWSANSVTNKCAINACATGYTRGGTASSTGTSFYTCSANCNSVRLNAAINGGSGNVMVYKRTDSTTWYSDSACSTTITTLSSLPTKTNAKYVGYYDTHLNSGGTQCVDSSGTLSTSTSCNVTGSRAFYARYQCSLGWRDSGTTIAETCTASRSAITLNNQGATSAGTATIYQTYNTNVYLDSARSKPMTRVANGITVPTKTGYIFGGYYDSTSYTNQYIAANGLITNKGFVAGKALTANGTWYAKWTPTCNAVTLDAETTGGSENTTVYKRTDSTTWYSDSACSTTITTLSSLPTKANATYVGHFNSGGTQCVDSFGTLSTSTSCNVTGTAVFYAQYRCNIGWRDSGTTIAGTCTANCIPITLDNTTNGGTGGTTTLYKRVGSTTIYSDSSCSTPLTLDKPTKTNATYAGHYDTSLNSGGTQCLATSRTWYSGYNPTSATTCYARYDCNTGYTASGTTIAGTCTATCNAITMNATQNGGSGTATTLYKKSGSTTWYSDNTCSTTITTLSPLPTKTNAAYAGHYNTSAASGGTRCVTATGWLSTSADCNVTGPTTFYPQFTCNIGWTNTGTTIAGTCTATCNAITMNATQNGGSGTATTLYKESGSTTWYSDNTCSTTITTLSPLPTKTNAAYAGHYNTSAASGGMQCVTAAGELSTLTFCNVTGATTFYPQFTCNTGWTNSGTTIAGTCTATTNTLTLNKNGGTGTCGGQSGTTDGSTTCTTGGANTLPTWDSSTCNITNGNKIFMGWSINSSATSDTTSGICPHVDLTYYAAWATPTCSATNGTCAITTPSGNAPRATITCSTGYSRYGGTNRTTSFTVTGTAGGTSVSGTCAPMTSTVSFNLNGGSGNQPNNVTPTYGSNMPGLSTNANPSRIGYTFGGWYDTSAATGGTQYYNTNRGSARTWDKTDASVTLYARWTVNNFTVVYNLNNGTGTKPANKACTYDAACALDAGTGTGYYRDGYVLGGWSTNISATSGSFDGKNLAASDTVNVYAVWTPCDIGTAKAAGTAAATACSACSDSLKYQNLTAQTSCKSVDIGYYKSSNSAQTQCDAGYRNIAATSRDECVGTFSKTGAIVDPELPTNCASQTLGTIAAKTCDYTKKYSGTIVTDCTPDSVTKPRTGLAAKSGYYVNGSECSLCSSLGGGMYKNSDNGNTAGTSACKTDSLVGKYLAKSTDTAATNCGEGKYKAAHTLNYPNTSSCNTATAGYYAPGPTSSAQTQCVVGSFSAAGASACTACGDGANWGMTTTSAGATSCNKECGVAGAKGYRDAKWNSNNTVTGLCVANSCEADYYLDATRDSNNEITASSCELCSSFANGLYPHSSNSGTSKGKEACFVRRNELPGQYIVAGAETATDCPAGTYMGTTDETAVHYGEGYSCKTCGADTYAAGEGNEECTACLENYHTFGDKTSEAACRISCPGGSYLAKARDTKCSTVGAGYWAGSAYVTQGNAGSRNACAAGLTTIGYGSGADEAADCGRVLHVGDGKLYLRSEKKTTPSLVVNIGGKTFYGNMSTETKKISDGSSQSLKIQYNNAPYCVYDDSGETYNGGGMSNITISPNLAATAIVPSAFNTANGETSWSATLSDGTKVAGSALCSATTGTSTSSTNPPTVSATGFTPEGAGVGCWCQLTSPAKSSKWVYATKASNATVCANKCGYYCANNMNKTETKNINYRTALYTSAGIKAE